MKNSKIKYANSINELRDIISVDSMECEAFATVISSWHFDNLLALINLKRLRNIICIITTEFRSTEKSKFRLKEDMIYPDVDDRFCSVIFFDAPLKFNLFEGIFLLFQKRNNKAVYINPGLSPNIKLLFVLGVKPASFYAIDEGLGTYLSISEFKKNLSILNDKKLKTSYIRDSAVKILNRILFTKKECYYLFNKQIAGNLVLNVPIAQCLYHRYKKSTNEQQNQVESSIFILIDNDLIINFKSLAPLFSKILSILSPKYNVYIKKHPNDLTTYVDELLREYDNVKLLDSSEGAESCIARYNPILIIGGYTTSLFTCSSIFDVKAISYMGLYANMEIMPVYKSQINYFIRCFEKNRLITFPNTVDEFLCNLKHTIDERS